MINDGGPAFPRPYNGTLGMTLHDYFAAAALTGLLAKSGSSCYHLEETVRKAYNISSLMLKEKIKNEQVDSYS